MQVCACIVNRVSFSLEPSLANSMPGCLCTRKPNTGWGNAGMKQMICWNVRSCPLPDTRRNDELKHMYIDMLENLYVCVCFSGKSQKECWNETNDM